MRLMRFNESSVESVMPDMVGLIIKYKKYLSFESSDFAEIFKCPASVFCYTSVINGRYLFTEKELQIILENGEDCLRKIDKKVSDHILYVINNVAKYDEIIRDTNSIFMVRKSLDLDIPTSFIHMITIYRILKNSIWNDPDSIDDQLARFEDVDIGYKLSLNFSHDNSTKWTIEVDVKSDDISIYKNIIDIFSLTSKHLSGQKKFDITTNRDIKILVFTISHK